MKNEHTDQLRQQLREHVSPEQGRLIRTELKNRANSEYIPTHGAQEYLAWMNANETRFAVQGPQSTNHPWYWGMFSVASQHVYGDCIEECMDKAMSAVGLKS